MPIIAPVITALMALTTLMQGGDIAAKIGGEDNIWQLLGLEPSKKTSKKMAKAAEKASASAVFRTLAAGEGKTELASLLSAGRSLEQESTVSQLETVLEGKRAGLDIADIIPAGMRPGRILQKLHEDEVEKWKKIRDAAPAREAPMAEGLRAPQPPSQLESLAGQGPVT
jgi:hypothetical protein